MLTDREQNLAGMMPLYAGWNEDDGREVVETASLRLDRVTVTLTITTSNPDDPFDRSSANYERFEIDGAALASLIRTHGTPSP